MSRLIPSAERIKRARDLIQQARDLPVPPGLGRNDFSYIARVKALLQEARDLVKFIPKTPTATSEMKLEVAKIYQETEAADRDILHISMGSND
jgi:hypothetical protein